MPFVKKYLKEYIEKKIGVPETKPIFKENTKPTTKFIPPEILEAPASKKRKNLKHT